MQEEGIEFVFEASGDARVELEKLDKTLAQVERQIGTFERSSSKLGNATDQLKRNFSESAQNAKLTTKAFTEGTRFSKQFAQAERQRLAAARVALSAERNAIAQAREARAQATLDFKKQVAEEKRALRELDRKRKESAREEAARQRQRSSARRDVGRGISGVSRGLGVGNIASELGAAASAAGPFGAAMAAASVAATGLRVAVDLSIASIKLQAQTLRDAVVDAARFQQEITRVNALVGGNIQSFRALRAAALEGGRTSLFTVQQSATALGFLAQAGFDAQKSIAALPGVLQLATAGNLDLAKTADIATNILTGYGKSASDLARVNDILTATFTNSNTNLRELGFGFSFAAGIANSTGQDLERISAIFGVLANNGVKGTRAGTAIANALQRLSKQTPAASSALERLGVQVVGNNGKLRQLTDVFRDLNKAGASASDILTIFGTVAGRSFIGPIQNGTAELAKLEAKTLSLDSVTQKLADTVADTAQSKFRLLESAVSALRVQFGTEFLESISGAFGAITDGVNSVGENTELISQFGQVGKDLVIVLANVAEVAAVVSRPFFLLGGAAIELAKGFDLNNSRLTRFLGDFLRFNPIIGPTVQVVSLLYKGFLTLVDGLDRLSRPINFVSEQFDKGKQVIDDFRLSVKELIREIPGVQQLESAIESIGETFDELLPPSKGFADSLRASNSLGKTTSDTLKTLAEKLREVGTRADGSGSSLNLFAFFTKKAKDEAKALQVQVTTSAKVLKTFGETIFTGLRADGLKGVVAAVQGASKAAEERRKRQLEINSLNAQAFSAENNALTASNALTRRKFALNARIAKIKADILKGTLDETRGNAKIVASRRQIQEAIEAESKKGSDASKKRQQQIAKETKQYRDLLGVVGQITQQLSSRLSGFSIDPSITGVLDAVANSTLNIRRLRLEANDAIADGNVLRAIELRTQADLIELERKTLDPLTKADQQRQINLKRQRDINKALIRSLRIQADLAQAQGDLTRAAELRGQIARLSIENQTNLSKADKARLRTAQQVNESNAKAQRISAQSIALAESSLEVLRAQNDASAQRNIIVQEYELSLQRIAASDASEAVKSNQRLRAQIVQRQQLVDLSIQQAQAVADAVRQGVDTDVRPLIQQGSNNRQSELQDRLGTLQSSREFAQERGADTTLLEQQIELQQKLIEQERVYQQQLERRIELIEQGSNRVVDFGQSIASLIELTNASTDAWKNNAAAQKAATSAISAVAGLGSVLADAFVESAKTRARIEGAINAAAAVANFALYAASSFTAQQYLTAGIGHTVASAKYFAVAGSGSGASAGPGSGGASNAGISSVNAVNIDHERARTAEVIAKAVADGFGQAQQVVYNIDFGQSTQLASAVDVARSIYDVTQEAEEGDIQAGELTG